MPLTTWDPKSIELLREFMALHIPFNKYLGMEVAICGTNHGLN